jgi:hypothetical protein
MLARVNKPHLKSSVNSKRPAQRRNLHEVRARSRNDDNFELLI